MGRTYRVFPPAEVTGTMTHRAICNRCGVNVGLVPLYTGHPEDKPDGTSAHVIWSAEALSLPPLPRLIMWDCPACDWQN